MTSDELREQIAMQRREARMMAHHHGRFDEFALGALKRAQDLEAELARVEQREPAAA